MPIPSYYINVQFSRLQNRHRDRNREKDVSSLGVAFKARTLGARIIKRINQLMKIHIFNRIEYAHCK